MNNSKCPFSNPKELYNDFKEARLNSPIVFSEELKAWLVTKYDDIIEVLRNPSIFSSEPTVPVFPEVFRKMFQGKVPVRGTLLSYDNPDHDRLRKSVSSFFVPRRLQRFEPMMRKEAHLLIDKFINRGKANLKAEFALPLPLKMITAIVGLDPDRYIWVGQCLAFYGGHEELIEGTMEEKAAKLIELHEYIVEVMAQRKKKRRDDLISHIWNVRDSGEVEMTDFEMLSMFPGLMLAGHETTTNFLCTSLSHLLHSGQYNEAQEGDTSRARALEELLRFESAITGMRRRVKFPVRIGSHTFKPGDELFLAYSSGSRDEQHFSNADMLDIKRQPKEQHLGFGRGIHACLGAPLARLLLGVEYSVIKERLPNLRLAIPYDEIQYLHVGEGRGIKGLPVEWDIPAQNVSKQQSQRIILEDGIELTVASRTLIADNILLMTLKSPSDESLPEWQPGAHLTVETEVNMYRQYSLCGDFTNKKEYKIAVLLESHGRGGSKFIHENITEGAMIKVRPPRNNFHFVESNKYLFIAGGIGITPILPMIHKAEKMKADWQLVYLGKKRSSLGFVNSLIEYGDKVILWPKAEKGVRFDLESLNEMNLKDRLVYCCGPTELIESVEELFSKYDNILYTERFQPRKQSKEKINKNFKVILARSGQTLDVPADKSILEVVNEAGVGVLSTCQQGTCGTCETKVISGEPEHRDSVLTPGEQAENQYMMICVSRCKGKKLILDI